MSFQFKSDEEVAQGVKRIAVHQLESVIRGLGGRSRKSRAKTIHETRKRLKKLRALVRLTREAMGRKSFHCENRTYRDAARPLSVARDAYVLVTTMDVLIKNFKGDIARNAFRQVRVRLASRDRALTKTADQPGITAILRDLRTAKLRVQHWHFCGTQWDVLSGGLLRTYGDGRRAMKKAFNDHDDEVLHDWRKRVKDLRHQVELLEDAWPDTNEKLARELRHLADLLGDDHDLAVLRTTLLESPDDFGGEASLTSLIGLIDSRRVELQHEAEPIGRRLYAEKPRAFVQRMRSYWHAWRKGQ